MATQLTTAQRTQISQFLSHDKACNFTELEYILKQILSGRSAEFAVSPTETITLSPQEAWQIIADWGRSEDGNLPLGDKDKSIKTGASRLLYYLQTNIIGKNQEVAAAYYHTLEQARTPFKASNSKDVAQTTLEKTLALRHAQLEAYTKSFLGKLATRYEQSQFLATIPDPTTRRLVAATLAANSGYLRAHQGSESDGLRDRTTTQLHANLLAYAGVGQVNSVIHRLHSQAAEEKYFPELRTITEATIHETYGNDADYMREQAHFSELVGLGLTISDIAPLVNASLPSTPESERQTLINALTTEVALAARGQHTSVDAILEKARQRAGLKNGLDPATIQALTPYLEEIETTTRGTLTSFGQDLFEKDRRLLSTYNLAAELHVDPLIPWITDQQVATLLADTAQKYPGGDLEKLLQDELSQPDRNVTKIGDLRRAINLKKQHKSYRDQIRNNPLLASREAMDKALGNFQAIKEPYDKLVAKITGAYATLDDIVTWPARTIAEPWFKLQEKYPLVFNPLGLVYNKWVDVQKGAALGVFKWSKSLARSGEWYSGFFNHIADYSKVFYKSDASWTHANFLFFERKWGNILDWTAQKAFKKATWSAAKTSFWESIAKGATAIGNKIAAGLGDKVGTTILGLATSEAGIGLIILGAQAALAVGKFVIDKIRNFVQSVFHGDASNLFGFVPLALAGFFASIGAFFLGAPAIIATGIGLLLVTLSAIAGSLATLFTTAVLWAGGAILFVTILLFFGIKMPAAIDPGTGYQQFVASIVCDSQGDSNNPASAAVCIADYLIGCKLSPLHGTMIGGAGWKCLLAQTALTKEAIAAIELSAPVDNNFQCVGMAAAYVGQAFHMYFPQTDAKNYANNAPKGFDWVHTCKEGSLFVDTGGAFGHIGVVVKCGPANIICVDANYAGPGVTRNQDTCRYDTSKIAGYLVKM